MRRPPFRRTPFRTGADSYKAPGADSPRARSAALQFLTGARTLDGMDGPTLARRYNLKPMTAQALLEQELERRERLV